MHYNAGHNTVDATRNSIKTKLWKFSSNNSNVPIISEYNWKCHVKQNKYLQLRSCHTDSLRVQLPVLYVKNQNLHYKNQGSRLVPYYFYHSLSKETGIKNKVPIYSLSSKGSINSLGIRTAKLMYYSTTWCGLPWIQILSRQNLPGYLIYMSTSAEYVTVTYILCF